MDNRKGSGLVVTCPDCSRKYVARAMDFTRKDEICCPYCKVCFKTGNDIMEGVQKVIGSARYHY